MAQQLLPFLNKQIPCTDGIQMKLIESDQFKQSYQSTVQKPRSNNTIQQTKYQIQEKENRKTFDNTKHKNKDEFYDVFMLDVIQSKYQNRNDLYLTGILQNNKRIVIKVSNIKRCLYFVLKPDVNQNEAKQQIRDLLRKNNIRYFEGEIKDMKYVFEIKDIPRGDVRVYEIRYSFSQNNKPDPATVGHTFTYIIGTTYTPLQIFIIRNKIKGPQWLRIHREYFSNSSSKMTSFFQKVQYQQLMTPQQAIDTDIIKQNSPPSLRLISISLKLGKLSQILPNKCTNKTKNTFVIYSLNYTFYQNYRLGSKQLLAPSQSTSYYLNGLKKSNIDQKLHISEKSFQDQNAMLSCLLQKITSLDPDVIVSHDFNKTLNIITSKLATYQNKNMQKMGRIRLDNNTSGQKSPTQRISSLIKGRIVVDTMKHAQEFIKTGDHKLSTVSYILSLHPIKDIPYETVLKMIQCSQFSNIMNHTYFQSINTFQILIKLQILEATLKLSNICGYLWQKVLDQNRAQRNEFLIMHQCYNEGYIIPDKFYFQDQSYDGRYEGGMVLDPKKGLHNGFIVLLDFVSLYPSIIRQYNICFSKIKRNLLPISHYVKHTLKQPQEQQIKVYPCEMQDCSQQNWGLFPKLVNMLVTERQKYKKLVAASQDPQTKSIYNTTQTAYKLVANSLYGCLGYQKSRFYAKDLAALITRLGRQSLQNAKQIIQNWVQQGEQCFQIIYGDTDSLMIKVQLDQSVQQNQKLAKTLSIMSKVANQVNSFYNIIKMQIDGVFSSIFLAAKKKYAGNKLTNLSQITRNINSHQKIQPQFSIEYKGVQTIRNDSSKLLKDVTSSLFKILLQPLKTVSDIISQVYEYFVKLKQTIKQHRFDDYQNYILRKILNKDPNLYPGQKGIYHVIVAKQLIIQGHRPDTLINHMIEYIMVKKQDQTVPIHVGSYLKQKQKIEIDKKYYKERQIFPVISRILKQIKNIDMDIIKTSFLQQKTKKKTIKQNQYISIISEVDKQKQIIDLRIHQMLGLIQCPKCQRKYKILRNGIFTSHCQFNSCQFYTENFNSLISNTITLYLFQQIKNYYSPVSICQKCSTQYTLHIKQCSCSSRKFRMNFSLSTLHDNLYFLQNIIQRHIQNKSNSQNISQFTSINKMIQNTLDSSAFEIINKNLFKKLKFTRL